MSLSTPGAIVKSAAIGLIYNGSSELSPTRHRPQRFWDEHEAIAARAKEIFLAKLGQGETDRFAGGPDGFRELAMGDFQNDVAVFLRGGSSGSTKPQQRFDEA